MRRFLALILSLLSLFPSAAMACTVCFGDPDAPITKAAKVGILFLLIVTVAVLGTFGAVFLKWRKRARELEKADQLNF